MRKIGNFISGRDAYLTRISCKLTPRYWVKKRTKCPLVVANPRLAKQRAYNARDREQRKALVTLRRRAKLARRKTRNGNCHSQRARGHWRSMWWDELCHVDSRPSVSAHLGHGRKLVPSVRQSVNKKARSNS